MATNPIIGRGFRYAHLDADAQLLAGKGVLHTITINKRAGTSGVITVYDSLTEAGTVIAAITVPNGGQTQMMPVTLIYDVAVGTGLFIGFDNTIAGADITVSYY